VLFADVKGSMDLAEQVDPEEWHKIMDRFFAILSEGIRSRRSRSQRPRLSIARSRGRPFSVT
jgi:class 3 adenylate cyclase